jgi:hypothetical protein
MDDEGPSRLIVLVVRHKHSCMHPRIYRDLKWHLTANSTDKCMQAARGGGVEGWGSIASRVEADIAKQTKICLTYVCAIEHLLIIKGCVSHYKITKTLLTGINE